MTVQFEPVIGRYLRLDLLGRSHWIYVDEAGQGVPLLCLHTAGSDGRQYRALELDKPIVMGCSIGGRIVLHLALEHPGTFRSIIGLQAGAHVDPYYDLNFLHRPDIHGGEVCAAIVSGLVGPHSPESERWETLWHYMQGGPGIFKGDLHFYKLDGDIRDRVAQIDTKRCPLYLLSGEYDYSCTPKETLEVARGIPGSEVKIMEGLGHFPMSEDPRKFIQYLSPVLQKIRSQGTA